MAETLLTPEDTQFFRAFRKGTQGLFDLGDRTNEILVRARGVGLPNMIVYQAVGEESGLGWRRVEKLAKVAERFPSLVRQSVRQDLPFSYFEEAMVFQNGDGEKMLEYVEFRLSKDNRWPASQFVANDFRRDVLGLDVGFQPGVTVAEPTYPPPDDAEHAGVVAGSRVYTSGQVERVVMVGGRVASPLDHPGFVEKVHLVNLLGKWKQKWDSGSLKADDCIYDLANLLAERPKSI